MLKRMDFFTLGLFSIIISTIFCISIIVVLISDKKRIKFLSYFVSSMFLLISGNALNYGLNPYDPAAFSNVIGGVFIITGLLLIYYRILIYSDSNMRKSKLLITSLIILSFAGLSIFTYIFQNSRYQILFFTSILIIVYFLFLSSANRLSKKLGLHSTVPMIFIGVQLLFFLGRMIIYIIPSVYGNESLIMNFKLFSAFSMAILLIFIPIFIGIVIIIHLQKENQKNIKFKTVLLTEMNHRIKNNLSIVYGLLQAESSHYSDQAIQKSIDNALSRIKVISRLHDLLTSQDDVKVVDCKAYFGSVINQIRDSYLNDDISISYVIDSFPIRTKTAISLGMILNEIVTNAVKFAFSDTDNPEIMVSVKKGETSLILSVSDNGVGMIVGESEESESVSFGQEIIKTLIENMDGDVSLDSIYGTKVIVKIPLAQIKNQDE